MTGFIPNIILCAQMYSGVFFFSSRRRHTRFDCDWSSDVCSSDLWMGTTGGGAFKTTDGGNTWLPAADKYFGGTIGAFGVSESNPDVVYVGTGEYPKIGRASCRERV